MSYLRDPTQKKRKSLKLKSMRSREYELVYHLKDLIHNLNLDQTSCHRCKNPNSDLIRTPNCDLHNYCPKCINEPSYSRLNLYCPKCEGFFNSITRKISRDSLSCFLCPDIQTRVPNINCSIHKYCIKCENYLFYCNYKEIKRVSQCRACTDSVEKWRCNIRNNFKYARKNSLEPQSPDYPHSCIERDPKNYQVSIECHDFFTNYNSVGDIYVGVNPYCVICNKEKEIEGYLCDHNFCQECISVYCFKQILEFYKRYQTDGKFIMQVFSYKCLKEGCDKEVSVPTQKILSFLNRNLNEFIEKYHIDFRIAASDEIIKWIPYFDGLDPYCVFPIP